MRYVDMTNRETTPEDQIDQSVWLSDDDTTETITGLAYLRRHAGFLPPLEEAAVLDLIDGRPYDLYYAKLGCRRLVGRSVIPACGFFQEEKSEWLR